MSTLLLAGIVLSGAWTQLDELAWIGWMPLALAILFDFYEPLSLKWSWRMPTERADRAAVSASLALCALFLAHLALTFREEFGFGGDEGYHLSATRAFAIYFMRAGPLLVAVAATYGFLVYRGFQYAGSVAIGLLIAASYALPASALFGRYPTAFYLLAAPLNIVFEALASPYPYAANHVVNTLSLPVWLFVLRPLIIGRWPDWRVMVVATLVYLQPTALTLLASPLLEPWGVVFALLSIEALAAFEAEQRWIAVPLCMVAMCFKETFVLLLPTVWLLACVEWRGGRPSARRHAFALAIAASAPFLLYYAVRSTLSTARGYETGSSAALWTMARAGEWVSTARAQVGAGGLIAIGSAFVLSARTAPLWAATAIGIALFFFADAISAPWTGYARFLAYSLIAVCGALFATIYRSRIDRRFLIAFCAVALLLQSPSTLSTFALDFSPDHERNSLEWRGGLIRMPIRALASQIPDLQGGSSVRRVRVITFGTDLTSLRVAYPDLASRYELIADQQSAPDCRCRDNQEAILAGFEWPANLGDTPSARDAFSRLSTACVSQVETTCVSRSLQRDRTGAVVGALGVGRALLLALPQHDERPQR
jgi:hypothetical protein